MDCCVITPTRNRHTFLPKLYTFFCAQTYPLKRWYIVDSSPTPSSFLTTLSHDDQRVVYIHREAPLSIGEKRNLLVSLCPKNSIIVHWDDDDYYAPNYLDTVTKGLQTADFVKLRSWYCYSYPHDFWGYFEGHAALSSSFTLHGQNPLEWTDAFYADLSMAWGYGFSYAYYRYVWEAHAFDDINFGEDHEFVLKQLLNSQFTLQALDDETGLALHCLHAGNTSQTFPQYRLPTRLVPMHFQQLIYQNDTSLAAMTA
jgi:glycosyltransferase involved in cell wall biosynthesis